MLRSKSVPSEIQKGIHPWFVLYRHIHIHLTPRLSKEILYCLTIADIHLEKLDVFFDARQGSVGKHNYYRYGVILSLPHLRYHFNLSNSLQFREWVHIWNIGNTQKSCLVSQINTPCKQISLPRFRSFLHLRSDLIVVFSCWGIQALQLLTTSALPSSFSYNARHS